MGGMKNLLGDKPYQLPHPKPERAFDGGTYDPPRDHVRLKGQLMRVFDLMKDGQWRTLDQIASAVDGTPQAVSARLRDFRKAKYGSRTVDRQSAGSGLFKYRLVL